jgi:hypothetical protein
VIAEAGTGSSKAARADAVGARAADEARAALVESVGAGEVGEHLGHRAEGERVVTHFFACRAAGYRGWQWAVTVARAPRAKTVTVDEVVLLPGDEAIVAPAWVPWRDRVKPGDLGPGDILPPDEDDPRLVPAYLTGDPGDDLPGVPVSLAELGRPEDERAYREVGDELGLGRVHVLSLEGRDQAAERWYDGDAGPDSPLAQSAPASCGSCGFLLRLAGPLATVFGVCANAYANDDGRVVSLDHGCGAHSEARLSRKSRPQPLPEPVVDTLTGDDLETF